MIYLDNAATTFPKPAAVVEALTSCVTQYGGNPGRGAHPLSVLCAEKVYDCRIALAAFFGAECPERILFTHNTTYALNLAIKGLFGKGDHVLISELEHNAVRRPLCALHKTQGVSFERFPVVGCTPSQILAGIQARLRPNTKGVICTQASNVCSITLPLAEIGAFCRTRSLFFVVDAAQSAGHLPIHMQQMQISALAAPAHKALYGIQGVGVLALRDGIELPTLMEGGSGVDSLASEMPPFPPERYEAGTLPTPGIVALAAGLDFIRAHGLPAIAAQENALFRAARERLESLHFTVYQREQEGAVLLFNHAQHAPEEIAHRLARENICVRAGYHCAPFAHEALGTLSRGAVRLSFGLFNTVSDLDALWKALK